MRNLVSIPSGETKWLFIFFFFLLSACGQTNNGGNEKDDSEAELSLSNLKNNNPTPEASALALAAQYDELKAFTQAAATIDLAEVLEREDGQFTIFAPTNEAFKAAGIKVDSGSVEQNKRLEDLILQHVVSQHTASNDWIDELSYTALNQGKITITIKDSIAYANDAKIIATDIQGVGGVLHIIDKVLVPKENTVEIR